jgi:hypothetical protein
MITKLRRLLTEWKEIFANYTCDKGLITRIYRELKKLNFPKVNNLMKKWANELNRPFSKKEVQMAKEHIKKCSTFLAIKKLQIKTMLRFYLTSVRIATIKKLSKYPYLQTI